MKTSRTRGLILAFLVSVTPALAVDIIVDNTSATTTGTWSTSTTFDRGYQRSYLAHTSGGTGANYVTYSATIPTAGSYDIYYWLPNGTSYVAGSTSDRATNAQFTVFAGGSSTTYTVNEQPSGGAWIKLGTQTFTTSSTNNGMVVVSDQGNNSWVIADAVRFVTAGQSLTYNVRLDLPQQTILGLGVEIESDSIGTAAPLPTTQSGVPHDLTSSEQTRFATDMVGRGNHFRYIRLALGLYLRGLTSDNKNIIGRWSTQMSELASLVSSSGVEGVDAEYWSPATYWKTPPAGGTIPDLIGGSLTGFDSTTLGNFGDAVVADLNYLQTNGVPVSMFGLQNEPLQTPGSYSYCVYTQAQYVSAFNAVAPKVRTNFPGVQIHVNSWQGQDDPTLRGGVTSTYVDAWTWHEIGVDASDQIKTAPKYNANTGGKPVYNNEFEYFNNDVGPQHCVGTANSIINWMVFENSPTWFWLHALKPTSSNADGYCLGWWRPTSDTDYSKHSTIATGHWDYQPNNWESVAGFLDFMPWNSVRYQVDEVSLQYDYRIMAFRQGGSSGKLVLVVTNHSTSASFTFPINTGLSGATFRGYRYAGGTSPQDKVDLGTVTGGTLNLTLPNEVIDFWVQQ